MVDGVHELENSPSTALDAVPPQPDNPEDRVEEQLRNEAATKVQSSFRGRKVRKNLSVVSGTHAAEKHMRMQEHAIANKDKKDLNPLSPDEQQAIENQQSKLQEIQTRVAAAKIQKARRKQMEEQKKQQKRHEDKAALKIQAMWSNKQKHKAKLKIDPVDVSRLDEDSLVELRHVLRKPKDGGDAQPADETRRVLQLLMRLPPFELILSEQPPRARFDIAFRLEPRQLQAAELLMRTKEVYGDDNDSTCSVEEERTEDDVACLILCGSAGIFLEGPGISKIDMKLQVGSAFGREAIDEKRINEPYRGQFELEAKAKNTIEVVRLSQSQVDAAAAAERIRQTSRTLACNTLKSSSPWCRETEDLCVLRAYLMGHVPCFEGIEEEEVDKVCQQAEYTQIACWEYLSHAGEAADGLRIFLSGSAIVSCPLPPALAGQERQTLSDLESQLYEEDECGEWELCLDRDAWNVADVVATSDCEVLFVPRALYQRHLRPVRMLKVLQDAACSLLLSAARAMQSTEQFRVDLGASGFLEAGNIDSTPDACAPLSSPASRTALEEGVSQEDAVDASSDGTLEDTEPAPPAWLTPEAIGVVEGMLNVRGEPCLPLLRLFPQSLRRKICAHAKLWRACRGEQIFAENDPGDSLIVVIRGEVGLFRVPYDSREEHQQWELQHAEFHDELARQAREAADQVFARRKTKKAKTKRWKRSVLRRATPKQEEDWFDTLARAVKPPSETDSDSESSEGRPMGSCISYSKRFSDNGEGEEYFIDPAMLIIQDLAMSVLDVVGRRWQNLHVARFAHLPADGEKRYFIRSVEAEHTLTGQEIAQDDRELKKGEMLVDIDNLGLCTDCVSAGQALGMAAPGLPGGGPARMHSAVAVTSTTDLLVFDGEAVNKALAEMREGIPNGQLAAALLRTREGSKLTPQDLLILDDLIQKHQAFSNLECRARAELCRRMRYARVPAGEVICQEGEQTTHFVQILGGSALVYVRDCRIPGAPFYDGTCDGFPVLCASGGNTFGEQGLLGQEEVVPQTVRAVEDVDLFRISCEDYAQVTQDWCSEPSMRRRAIEALRTLNSEQTQVKGRQKCRYGEKCRLQGNSAHVKRFWHPNEGAAAAAGSSLDLEAVVHVLQGVGFMDGHDLEVCREIARHTSILHVPKGEFLVGFGDSASDDDSAGLHVGKAVEAAAAGRKSASGRSFSIKGAGTSSKPKMLRIVLSGCIGLYYSKEVVGAQEELSSQLGGGPSMSEAGSGQVSGDRADEHVSGVYLEVQQVQSSIQALQDTVGKKPLQASMADRMRLSRLQKKLAELEGSIREAEDSNFGSLEQCTPPISLSRSFTPNSAMTRTATQVSLGFGATDATTFAPGASDEQFRHERIKFVSDASANSGSPLGASLLEDRFSTDVEATQDWTTLLASVEGLSVDFLDVIGCDLELREGESFGGLGGSAGAMEVAALNFSDGDRFRAHADTELLVLSQADYEHALEMAFRRSNAARAAFLAKHFPSEASADLIDRLTPLFREDTRSMGGVVLREGTQPTTIWMILSGQCQCLTSPGSHALEAVAIGEEMVDDTTAGYKQACANVAQKVDTSKGEMPADDTLLKETSSGSTGNICRSVSGQMGRSGTGSQNVRNGTRDRGTPRSVRAPPSSAPADIAGCTSRLGSAVGRGRTGKALGILKEGQFVGLFSALFHQPEPLTVVASSAQVELLAIPKSEFFSRLPGKILGALKESMRAERDWYVHRSAHVATLPGQVLKRMEKLRSDLQQVHIPRMIDSPFLRRQGTAGLDMLDRVCDRYGELVHPESEWLFATRSPNFFHNIRMANVIRSSSSRGEEFDKAAVIDDSQFHDEASAESHSANRRFHRFQNLSQKMQESAYDNEYIAPETSDRTRLLSPKSVSQLNITNTTTFSLAESVAEEMGLVTEKSPVHTRLFAPCVPTSSEDAVPLLTPSRAHRLTSYGELAQQKKTLHKASKLFRIVTSPGRPQPTAEKVTFRSKAMRDKQAGLSVSSKVDISGSVESRRIDVSEQSGELAPQQLTRKRPTELLPDICADVGDESPGMHCRQAPRRQTFGNQVPFSPRGSLRRSPTAADMQSKVFSPDKGIEVGMCRQGSPRESRKLQPPDGLPATNRPAWRRSRLTKELAQAEISDPRELVL